MLSADRRECVQVLFPKFQKNITQGYVSEDEAGRRLASVVGDKSYSKSGVYWSWDSNSEPFVNTLAEEAQVRHQRTLPCHVLAGGVRWAVGRAAHAMQWQSVCPAWQETGAGRPVVPIVQHK